MLGGVQGSKGFWVRTSYKVNFCISVLYISTQTAVGSHIVQEG